MQKLIFALLIPLAACASPRERCITKVTKDLLVLDRLIVETAGNVERGYALEPGSPHTVGLRICSRPSNYLSICTAGHRTTKPTPVIIDVDAERRKLAQLRAKRAEKQHEANIQIAACNATFPNG